MNTITIKKEDADYWESLLREKSLNLKDRGLQEDTILAKWSVHLGWGVTAWLKVYSGATALTACMEWNRGGTFIIKSTPVRRTLLGEWPSPDGNTEDDVMVVIEGEDEKKETAPESADNPLLTFEEGKRLAESGEAKPDYAGDILFDKKYGVYPLQIIDHNVLSTNPSKLLDKWDFCMGVLYGLGYGEVSGSVSFSKAWDAFYVTIGLTKKAAEGAGIAHPLGRNYCRESLLNARKLTFTLNRVWDVLKKDVPPRLKETVIETLLTMRQPTDTKDGLVKLFDADWNVFIFEIHRGMLLRLDHKGNAIGAGLGALLPAVFAAENP